MFIVSVLLLVLAAAVLTPHRRPEQRQDGWWRGRWQRWRAHVRAAEPVSASLVLVEVAAQLRAGRGIAQAWQRALPQPVPGWAVPILLACGVAVVDPDWRSGAAVSTRPPIDRWLRRGRDAVPDGAELLAATAACSLAHRSGAPLAEVIDVVVAAIAEANEAQEQRRTALAGPRSTARLLSWLPLAGLATGVLLGADPLSVLLGSAAGAVCLVAGAALFIAGHRWVAVLVRQAERAGR
ncbi:MAG: type II secretion system F family protein [Beutenbergiaceae bacterium]